MMMTRERAEEECMTISEAYKEGYDQGRADKYQEIITEYMLLTEKQVAEIRADAIDKMVLKLETDMPSKLDEKERYGYTVALTILLKQLKEQKDEE